MISSDIQKWRFWDYAITKGNNLFNEWYEDDLSDEGRYQLDALLKNCSKIERLEHWLGFKRFLVGKYSDQRIWELKFRADKREYRILGVFHASERKQVVLLLGCYHKDKVYTPRSALDTAHKRAKRYKENGATLYERTIKSDL